MERNLTSELSVDYLFFVAHLIVLFLLCDVSIFSYQPLLLLSVYFILILIRHVLSSRQRLLSVLLDCFTSLFTLTRLSCIYSYLHSAFPVLLLVLTSQ